MLSRNCVHFAQRVMVLGGGTMGAGIAQVSAAAGKAVSLVDTSESILAKSKGGIAKSLTKIGEKKFKEQPDQVAPWVNEVLSRISFTTDTKKAAGSVDLVIEAIVEDLAVKKAVWSQIDSYAGKDTMFASNTSSLSIKAIAEATKREELFGGLHFFSPVPLMKLVEVVSTDKTTQQTSDALVAYATDVGKTPITCKDTKGFVVNRLLIPLIMEAVRMIERGDATVETIDTAMKLGAGHPMGPLQVADSVGNDVLKMIVDGWHKDCPEEPLFNPSPLLTKMVEEGALGNKAGKGFYDRKKSQ